MIGNIVSLLVLVLLVVLFAWLATRAWRAKRAFVKWPGVILAGLLTLVFGAITVVAVLGFVKLEARHANPVADLKVAGTAEQIARGGQLAWGCADCHSPAKELPLSGGAENFMAGGPPVGVSYATNLTPGGPLKGWSDGEIVRAIREGIGRDGRPLIVMPSQAYHNFSDADAEALVAYLRSQPAVANPQPPRSLNALGALFLGAGLFPTSAQPPAGSVAAPPTGPTAEYGKYLISSIGGCADCHGTKLDGVPNNSFAPPAPPLKPFAAGLNETQFFAVFRDGLRPDGSQVAEGMPWKNIGKAMSDDDLRAVQAYLQTLP
jgi:mono/diheme cytochrome c family protein